MLLEGLERPHKALRALSRAGRPGTRRGPGRRAPWDPGRPQPNPESSQLPSRPTGFSLGAQSRA